MNILIIEDSNTLAQLLSKSLLSYGYKVTLDNSNFANKRGIPRGIFDFVIINTHLGKDRSVEILNYIVEKSPETKILGVCNKGGWAEKVRFLNEGGDDVLTYPFPLQELLARIKSLIRRPKNYIDNSISFGDLLLDSDRKSLFEGNCEIPVRKKEYDLFEYLVKNKERPISRCELLDHVWDYRDYVGSNTVDVHVKRLRDKLPHKDIIQTVHGVGYRAQEKKSKAS
mgnify:CR=1 FL=1